MHEDEIHSLFRYGNHTNPQTDKMRLKLICAAVCHVYLSRII